jgi:hypothetical protein
MYTPALTLAAEFWRRHRLGLAGVAALIAAFAVTCALSPLSAKLASIHSMWFVMGLAYVIGVFAYGFDGKLESPESGFPKRLFVLPVRTPVLVAGPMIQGILLAVLLWLAWDRLVLRPSGVQLPFWWAALLAAIVAASQALVWLPFGVPFLRILVIVAVITLLIRAPVVLELVGGRDYADPDTQARAVTIVSLALVALSFATALAGVGRARRGDTPNWLPPARPGSTPSTRRIARPFSSALRAQVWYEWRARGRGFCIVCTLVVAVLILLGALLEQDAERQTNYGFVFLFMPLMLAMSWGPYAGTAGAAARDRGGLSPFAATRPFGNARFVGIKVAAALVPTLVAWVIVLLMLAGWWAYTGRPPELRPAWDRAVERFGVERAVVGCVLLVIAPILLTWRTYVVGLCTGLTGRNWLVPAQTVLGFLVFLQGMYEWTMWNADTVRRDRLLELLPWFAAALVVLKLGLAGCLVAAIRRRDLIDRPTLTRLLALWLFAAAILVALLVWLLPADETTAYAIALGVVLVLPLVRPLAAPLAFAWNRHR